MTAEQSRHATRGIVPWWSYETSIESLDDVCRLRQRVRSRLADQRGVRVVDVLLVIDVLLTDAFDDGFVQRDLRFSIKASNPRLVIALDAVDAQAAVGSTLAKSAGRTLLDLISTDWGVERRHGRKTTWAAIATARHQELTPGRHWAHEETLTFSDAGASLRAVP